MSSGAAAGSTEGGFVPTGSPPTPPPPGWRPGLAGGAAARTRRGPLCGRRRAGREDGVVGGVGAGDAVVDEGARAVDVERDHLGGDVAADVEGVRARAALEHGDLTGIGAEHVEVVVAAEAVDLDLLDVR